ncbi:hypothetical protein [Serratia fonticola]
MHLSEQQYIILFSLIKFYTRPQENMLRKFYGDDLYFETYQYFEAELEYFVNKKIALDRIYTSLSNASQTYAIFRQMESNGNIGPLDEDNAFKVFMSFNESFISALIINFSKLKEVLTFKKNLIIEDESLCGDFTYLDDLNNKITKANVTKLRNEWFAHAYEDKRKGIVYRDKDIKENILNILKELCSENHLAEFNKSKDRLRFFCETYLFEGYTNINLKSFISDVVNKTKNSSASVSTRPKEIIRELYLFSRKIRGVKLFEIESFFIVEDSELKEWSSNPKKYFRESLRALSEMN